MNATTHSTLGYLWQAIELMWKVWQLTRQPDTALPRRPFLLSLPPLPLLHLMLHCKLSESN